MDRYEWIVPKEHMQRMRELQETTLDAARKLSDSQIKLPIYNELPLNEQDKIWLRSIKVSA